MLLVWNECPGAVRDKEREGGGEGGCKAREDLRFMGGARCRHEYD